MTSPALDHIKNEVRKRKRWENADPRRIRRASHAREPSQTSGYLLDSNSHSFGSGRIVSRDVIANFAELGERSLGPPNSHERRLRSKNSEICSSVTNRPVRTSLALRSSAARSSSDSS